MRDELFEAMITVCGWDYSTLTPKGRDWINAGLKDIRPVCDDPQELLKRGRRYYNRWGYATPTSMAKHFAAFGDPTTIEFTPQDCTHLYQEGASEDHRGQYCVRCKTWIPNVTQLRLIEGGDTA